MASTNVATTSIGSPKGTPTDAAKTITKDINADGAAQQAGGPGANDGVDKALAKPGDEGSSEEKPLSKNKLKKKRRWERAMEIKKRRKQQDKEIKVAKAKKEGRDLDQERLEQKERFKEGEGRKRKQERWEKDKVPKIEASFQVCIDCSFESLMTYKEINSLSNQIRYCYAFNRSNPHPCALTVTSLLGPTLANLQRVSGFDDWATRAFSYSEKPANQVFQDRLKDVVYLTSDSENTIEHLDDSKIYVIGGIVDRNRLPYTAIKRAEEWGLETARLPLENLKMKSSKVLTCNHVFEILLKYRMFGKDWEKALLEVLPSRKEAQADSHETAAEEGSKTEEAVGQDEAAKEDDKNA